MPIDSYFDLSKRNYIFFILLQLMLTYCFVTYHSILYVINLHFSLLLYSFIYSSSVRSTLVSYFSYLSVWMPKSCCISSFFFSLNNFIKTSAWHGCEGSHQHPSTLFLDYLDYSTTVRYRLPKQRKSVLLRVFSS